MLLVLDIFGFIFVLNDGMFGSLLYLLDLIVVDVDVFELKSDGNFMRIDICCYFKSLVNCM